MANIDDLQKQMEARLAPAIAELAGAGKESDLALVRALIHRGVHLLAERRAGEFCALATYVAEMLGHAHGLMHGADPAGPAHTDRVH
ncbi:MAG TPA: hypothetical protein VGP07_24625 [Polyangia bacterium]|jgi:hypothetical protein